MKKIILLSLLLISISIKAQSQAIPEVEIAKKRAKLLTDSMAKLKPKLDLSALKTTFKYQLGMNFDLARGNQNFTNFLPQLGVILENRLFGLNTNVLYNYATLNGNRLNNDLILRNSARILPQSRVQAQVLAGGEKSRLRNLAGRSQTGLGFGFNLLRKENNQLRLVVNGVYDQSRYEGNSFINDAARTTNTRAVYGPMLQLSGQHQLAKGGVLLTYDIFNLVALNQKNDYRVNAISSLVIPVFKSLNLRSSLIYSYENVILTGTQHGDLFLTFGFGFGQF